MPDSLLEKTTRYNALFDFYDQLLTEKQQTFMKYYYQDNFSLSEIADLVQISRQAVNEHIKRAEVCLEDYESKLKLLEKFEMRKLYHYELSELFNKLDNKAAQGCKAVLRKLINVE